jgi:hypothetical protein
VCECGFVCSKTLKYASSIDNGIVILLLRPSHDSMQEQLTMLDPPVQDSISSRV